MEELITINQLTDILQVDRLTVYRMLKDGRIKGVKVGRQWRVPRSEVTELFQGAGDAEAAADLRPSEVLPVHCLQVIQDVFAEMVGLGSLTTDMYGEPLTGISNSCEFCNLIRETPSGREACVESWRTVVNAAGSQPEFIPCHAGLLYARANIEQNGKAIAAQIAGQFYVERPDEAEDQARVRQLADTHGIDPQQLMKAARRIRRLKRGELGRVGRWLARVAETFEVIALERADLIGRLEGIALLSNFED